MNNHRTSKTSRKILIGILIGILGIAWMVSVVQAESPSQISSQDQATPQVTPTVTVVPKDCVDCHPDKKAAWLESPHAQAFDDAAFQEGWDTLDQPGDCLLCHTTNYQEATGEYAKAGVSCEACHGTYNPEHPAVDYPTRSDQEACGTCHPAILGETQLSGHTQAVEAGCVNCHDPHSQKPLFENSDALCKECHKEDLAAMDKVMSDLHLRENITCAGCHTLDVPHTFLYNFRQNDVTGFMTGLDCPAELGDNRALRAESGSTVSVNLETEMNWPTVHKVSRAKSAMKCVDCHEMDEKTRADFKLLGYSDEALTQLSWEAGKAPTVTDQDVNLLVSKSRSGWSWVFWLIGAGLVFGLFEFFVTRKLKDRNDVSKEK